MLTLIRCQLWQWIWTIFCYYYYYYIIEVAHSIDLTTVCVNKNMQSGLRIAHSSLMKAMCWPNPAHDLSRAFWLARTQTPRIVRLHHWMLPDRTTILIPFNNTCSSGCNFILCTKCTLISKYVLNIANDTWNAPENQTRGIMVIVYRGNFYEAKRWSHRPQEFELTCLLLENHDPSCEMLRFGRSCHQNLCQTLPIFFHGVVRARHGHTSILMMSELHLNFL